MRYKGLDLNLLIALEVLLTERNVTRAAARLNLTQSATSSALARLREQLDDDLLVPAGRRFSLSPYAADILPRLRELLARIDFDILEKSGNDPSAARRRIRIMASDYVSLVMLGPCLAKLSAHAPGLVFDIVRITDTPYAAIESYSVDLLIAPDVFISNRHPSQEFFHDDYVGMSCIANQAAGSQMTLQQFLEAPHVTVRFQHNGNPTHDDRFFQRQGLYKTPAVSVPSHALIPYFLMGTGHIAVVQRKQAVDFCKTFPLKLFETPTKIPAIVEMFQWHHANDNDRVLRFVRDELRSAQAD